ncbi:unnamed protein product [Sphagnum jensenii]|jgi:hypothetical protein|uniref:Uncharacterized protein n=1 Tax=Sphagnum jensenii TaxID=128206 RepID=A0ABP0VM23_9BRYO
MRKKGSSWTGWRKQLKQYVTSGSKLPAVVQQQVNGENVIMKEVEDDSVNDHSDMLQQQQQQHVGDRSSTEPPSSCEDVKSDDASQTREEKQQQLRACIKADAAEDHAQLALAHFSPLTPPRPNSGSAPQTISPPTPSSRSTPNPAGVATSAALKKGAFKHVYRSGPVRKLSSRTKTSAAATAGVRTSPGGVEQETMAATAIQAAFRGYRSRRNSSEDVWSQAGAVYCNNNRRLEKELQGQTTQASSCTQTQMSQTAGAHLEFSTTADNKLNINGEWDTDTRSPADIEASAQYKQEAALKRERAREYALALRRLKYGLEQHKGGAKAAAGTPPPNAAADCTNTMLDKPGYVMNWLERAQGARDDHHVLKNVSDGTRNLLPASKSLSPKTTGVVTDGAEKAKLQSSGEKDKPKSGERMKLQKNGEKSNSDLKGVSSTEAAVGEARTPRCRNGDASERAFDTSEHLQEHSSPATSSFACPTPNHGTRRLSFTNGAAAAAAGHTGKGTGTVNNERRKSVGSCVSPAPMVLPPPAATDRRLSAPFAGMKAPLHSTTPKKVPFKV